MELPDASSRPSRLSLLVHIIVVGSLTLSFVSGVLTWYGQNVAQTTFVPPAWLHGCRVLHGSLNPLLCGVFGYLCCQHIRYGWALRTNWVSGLTMEATFLVLILTALPIYYADDGAFRTISVVVHQWLGVSLPVVLIAHWIAAQMWVKKILAPSCN